MTDLFTPPYPIPPKTKPNPFKRFRLGWNSWIHTLFEKSYTMKLGETHLPNVDIYMANDQDVVHRVLDDCRDADDGNPRTFPKHWLLDELLEPLVGNGIFVANGKDWEEQRRMMNPAFQHTHLKLTFPMMQAAVDEVIGRMAAEDLSRPLHIDPFMTHLAADIIFRTMFSVPLNAEGAARIFHAFHRFQSQMQPSITLHIFGLPKFGYRKRAVKAATEIHAVFAEIVRARYDAYHASGDAGPADILQSLLEARNPATGAPFSFDDLIDQISVIFLAGHETSASSMTWALYILSECPHVAQAMRAELDAATDGGPIAFETLKSLAMTRNVFKETLRLYPPVSFLLREVTAPIRFRDKLLKPKAMIAVSPWLLQRSPDWWQCPHAFDPDRFERPDQADAAKRAYLPFGRGPRICIGAGFAQQEAILLLASVVRRFDLAAIPGDKPDPISRLTLRPKHGARAMFRLRPSVSGQMGDDALPGAV